MLEETGLKSGRDFFLGFSPEREDPGNKDFETSTIPKVVAGDGADRKFRRACAHRMHGERVDGDDLDIWEGQFGTTPSIAAVAQIPEPAGATLLVVGSIAMFAASRRRS